MGAISNRLQPLEDGQEDSLTLSCDFLDALTNHHEVRQHSSKVALFKLGTKKALVVKYNDFETVSCFRNSSDHKVSTRHSKSLMGSALKSHKPELDRELFMERLDPATASHIVGEAFKVLP